MVFQYAKLEIVLTMPPYAARFEMNRLQDHPMIAPKVSSRSRDDFLDALRGLLSIFVVVVHAVSGSDPIAPSNDWYALLRSALDAFNMSAYMFVSGYIVSLSQWKAIEGDLNGYIIKRADRLLLPFFAIGLIILALKFIVATIAPVPNLKVDGFLDGLYSLFIDTERSPARAIWFVYALFWLTAIHIISLKIWSGSTIWLFRVFAIIYILWVFGIVEKWEFMYFDKFMRFGVYFFAGVIFGHVIRRELPQRRALAVIVVTAFLALLLVRLTHRMPQPWEALLAALSIFAFFSLPTLINNQVFRFFGRHTLIIYLLNTLAIGAVTVVVKKVYPQMLTDPTLFVIFIIVGVVIAGSVGPVLLRLIVFDRLPVVRKYVA